LEYFKIIAYAGGMVIGMPDRFVADLACGFVCQEGAPAQGGGEAQGVKQGNAVPGELCAI